MSVTEGQRDAPTVQRALPSWDSVLVVVAHPDDESFGLGAVLDDFVRMGAATTVLCLTQGEASTLGMEAELNELRTRELRRAADELGIGSTVLLNHPDAQLMEMPVDSLTTEVLREVEARPVDGILVFDPSGLTGHPDHVAATRAAVNAAARVELPVLAWTIPEQVATTLNTEFDTEFVGHTKADIDVVISVDRERQRAASLCHRSQAVPDSALWRRLELLGEFEHLRWLR